MQIAEPEVDNWLPVLAALNLRLKALGEPIWQLTIIPPPPVDTGKRFALFRQKTISSGLNTGRARTGLNERKNSGRMTAGLMCARIRKNCILCTACVAVCQEGAITIADNQFTVDKTKCSGCMSCRDVCFPKAIDVIPQAEKTVSRSAMLILMLIAAAAICLL